MPLHLSGALTKGVLVLGIDPVKEKSLSNVESRLVKYVLTSKVIDSLKKTDLPEEVISKMELYKDEAYSSESILQLDLGISDKDAPVYMPVIEKTSSFSNGYITTGKQEALVGYKLSEYLQLNIGDTLVLIGQGYHGTTAAGKFRIAGIVRMPTSDIDNKIVYLPVGCMPGFLQCSRNADITGSYHKGQQRQRDKQNDRITW